MDKTTDYVIIKKQLIISIASVRRRKLKLRNHYEQ